MLLSLYLLLWRYKAAKQKCQHGAWLEWLGENCPEITVKTAERYMALYEKGLSNSTLLSNLEMQTGSKIKVITEL
jgi:hypothetical protein